MNRTNSQAGGMSGSGKKRQYYSRYFAHYTKKYNGLLALGVLFLAGVLLGSLLIRTAGEDTVSLLLRMVSGYVENRRTQSLLQNFLSGLSSSLLFVGVLFVCGFCAIAQPAIVLMPLFRGLGTGFSLASLYASHGPGTIGFIGLLMLPGTVLASLAVLVCAQESLRLSSRFLAAMGGKGGQEGYPLRLYLARYLACVLLCAAAAFLDAALSFGFAKFFVL